MIKNHPDEMQADLRKAEWKIRTELAAAYRLVALFGWDDLVFTHLSARVPGPDHHFLINPYGLLFHEMTASSLVKVDQSEEHTSKLQSRPHLVCRLLLEK